MKTPLSRRSVSFAVVATLLLSASFFSVQAQPVSEPGTPQSHVLIQTPPSPGEGKRAAHDQADRSKKRSPASDRAQAKMGTPASDPTSGPPIKEAHEIELSGQPLGGGDRVQTPPGVLGWATIMSEDFEGAFPSGAWSVFDNNGPDYGELYWDDDDYLPHSGGWSAWAANGGADGLDPQTYYYPNNMASWMVYGPFDLSDASDAELLFYYWNQSELNWDWFGWYASTNGSNFYGYHTSGDSGGWVGENFDLTAVPTLGDVTGESSVWIAFIFTSDASNVDDGPFVDDIVLQKSTSAIDCDAVLAAFDEWLEGTTVRGANDPLPAPMPPHPDLLERVRRGEITLPDFVTNPGLRQQMGIDQPQELALAPLATWNALALLVEFTDNPSQVGASYFDSLLFGGVTGTLDDYYSAVSYGTLNIVTVNLPSSIGWCTMPQTYAYYVAGNYGMGTYPQNTQKLTEDAVLLADPLVDFSQYDNDGNGWVDTVFIIHAGPGAEFTGSPNDIWSHSWATLNDPVVDGVTVNSFTTEPEYYASPGDMTMGVYAHELGHVFGLPDLYDTDYSSYGVGDWSLMASGSWNGPWPGGGSPAFLDAWSRAQLGFVTPVVVTANTVGASIPAAETSQVVYRLWTNGSVGSQYFLVENRQQVGYDSALPGAGMLIWHVDEGRSNNTAECDQLNNWLCGSNHYLVALEQADGLWDLEHKTDQGDTGDPYPGSTNNRSFTFTSVPNSSSYTSSADTTVGVTNISNSGSPMTADLYVAPVGANTPPTLSGLPDAIIDHTTILPVQIDLWAYASDAETADSGLTYTIEGSPPPGAGVTIASNRWLTVNPSASWCGGTDVTVRATDPGGLWDNDTLRVAVSWSCPG